MSKSRIGFPVGCACITLLFPCIARFCIPSYGGMAAAILLLYFVNPAYSTFIGFRAGQKPRQRWFWPLLMSFLFLVGTWSFFDAFQLYFVICALVYLAISVAVMGITIIIYKYKFS